MRKKWTGPLLAFALVFSTVAATPALDGAAHAIDFAQACTLTVKPGSGEFADDLTGAKVILDLYKIADAVPVSGYDTYTYGSLKGYESLELGEDPDSSQWEALAQSAASIALKSDTPTIKGAAVDSPLPLPSCGLYLIVARGDGIEDYTVTETGEDGTDTIATIARSSQYTYTFTPSLVSLPSKAADEDGTANTAGTGEWIYDLTTTLKPGRELRYGPLEIVKTLQTYETRDPATFIFQVEATLNGENVYSDIVSLTFTEPGQKHTLIEKIPAAADVTITEVYSGAVYRPTSEEVKNTVIQADSVASVDFSNDYDDTGKSGGSVINHFEYSAENDDWDWTPILDNE